MYYALFQGLATYGIIAWGGAYENVLNKIQSLQNRLTGIMPNFNFMNIKQLFILESTLYHFKNLYNMYSCRLSNTRSKQIILPRIQKEFYKKSSIYTAIKTFNSMPQNLKEFRYGRKSLKIHVKKWLLQQSNNSELIKYSVQGRYHWPCQRL